MSKVRNLLQMPPVDVGLVFQHPVQMQMVPTVERLLTLLRACDKWPDYYQFQRMLFGAMQQAETGYSSATRALKRQAGGKQEPEAQFGTWDVEREVYRRSMAQLRAVGDAMAWRLFRYDRRAIIALSMNSPAGPMTLKEGLNQEIAEVEQAWKSDRTFALMHDLTSCLRIADLTKFTREGPRLVEVKKGAKRIPRPQMQRIRDAIDVINGKSNLWINHQEVDVFDVSEQFRTRVRDTAAPISRSIRDGVGWTRLGKEWMVFCVSLVGDSSFPRPPLDPDSFHRARDRAIESAGLNASKHHLRGIRASRTGEAPATAPYTIFPFDARTCALLTCDYVTVETILGWERLASAFEASGFTVTNPLPEESEETPPHSAVLQAVRGNQGLSISASGVNQILFEFVEPRSYARAVAEIVSRGHEIGTGVFTFANEKAVWR